MRSKASASLRLGSSLRRYSRLRFGFVILVSQQVENLVQLIVHSHYESECVLDSLPIDDGLALLQTVRGPHRDPEQLCEQVLALLARQPQTYDDVTLLALRADDAVDERVPV